jgi:hypothetical protein
VHAEEEAANDYRRAGMSPARPKTPVLVPPVVVDDEDDDEDDVEVMFAPTADVEDHEAIAEDTQPHGADEAPDVGGDDEADDLETDDETHDEADEEADDLRDEDHLEADDEDLEDDGAPQFELVEGDVTAEIDLTELRAPQPIEGDDPGPEFEPGYSPRP